MTRAEGIIKNSKQLRDNLKTMIVATEFRTEARIQIIEGMGLRDPQEIQKQMKLVFAAQVKVPCVQQVLDQVNMMLLACEGKK